MRGICTILLHLSLSNRFNPAYAGNMSVCLYKTLIGQVQPRVCGEYINTPYLAAFVIGSTPRMRGISFVSFFERSINRFNPAYAGNIGLISTESSIMRVQPRVCGEYPAPTAFPSFVSGSTPRMRGIYQPA